MLEIVACIIGDIVVRHGALQPWVRHNGVSMAVDLSHKIRWYENKRTRQKSNPALCTRVVLYVCFVQTRINIKGLKLAICNFVRVSAPNISVCVTVRNNQNVFMCYNTKIIVVSQ